MKITGHSSSLCSLLHFPLSLFLLAQIYRPQYPVLEHPQPMFLPQFHRPTFTPTQNDRQNYSSVYFNRYIIVYQTEHIIFCNK